MPLVHAPPVALRGYSAVELARAAGVSTGTIKHWFAEGLGADNAKRAVVDGPSIRS
ncbi:hypothetical protein WME75_38455 [Sorangium sp. So ce1014]|uniref:hypothetical protein n=1 Tax=Sorangium sp. So ce1014 TaxID=3133326 RepID=UPI003F609791